MAATRKNRRIPSWRVGVAGLTVAGLALIPAAAIATGGDKASRPASEAELCPPDLIAKSTSDELGQLRADCPKTVKQELKRRERVEAKRAKADADAQAKSDAEAKSDADAQAKSDADAGAQGEAQASDSADKATSDQPAAEPGGSPVAPSSPAGPTSNPTPAAEAGRDDASAADDGPTPSPASSPHSSPGDTTGPAPGDDPAAGNSRQPHEGETEGQTPSPTPGPQASGNEEAPAEAQGQLGFTVVPAGTRQGFDAGQWTATITAPERSFTAPASLPAGWRDVDAQVRYRFALKYDGQAEAWKDATVVGARCIDDRSGSVLSADSSVIVQPNQRARCEFHVTAAQPGKATHLVLRQAFRAGSTGNAADWSLTATPAGQRATLSSRGDAVTLHPVTGGRAYFLRATYRPRGKPDATWTNPVSAWRCTDRTAGDALPLAGNAVTVPMGHTAECVVTTTKAIPDTTAPQLRLAADFGADAIRVQRKDWALSATPLKAHPLTWRADKSKVVAAAAGAYDLAATYGGSDIAWEGYRTTWTCVDETSGKRLSTGPRIDVAPATLALCTVSVTQRAVPPAALEVTTGKVSGPTFPAGADGQAEFEFDVVVTNPSTLSDGEYTLDVPGPSYPGVRFSYQVLKAPSGVAANAGWGPTQGTLVRDVTIPRAEPGARATQHRYVLKYSVALSSLLDGSDEACVLGIIHDATLSFGAERSHATATSSCLKVAKPRLSIETATFQGDSGASFNVVVSPPLDPEAVGLYRVSGQVSDSTPPTIDLALSRGRVTGPTSSSTRASGHAWASSGVVQGVPHSFAWSIADIAVAAGDEAQLTCPGGGVTVEAKLDSLGGSQTATGCASLDSLASLRLTKQFPADVAGRAGDWHLSAKPSRPGLPAVSMPGDSPVAAPIAAGVAYTLSATNKAHDPAWDGAEQTWRCATASDPSVSVPVKGGQVIAPEGQQTECAVISAPKNSPSLAVMVDPVESKAVGETEAGLAFEYAFTVTVENSSTDSGSNYDLDVPRPAVPTGWEYLEARANSSRPYSAGWDGSTGHGRLVAGGTIDAAASADQPARHVFTIRYVVAPHANIPQVNSTNCGGAVFQSATVGFTGGSDEAEAQSSCLDVSVASYSQSAQPATREADGTWSVTFRAFVHAPDAPSGGPFLAIYHLASALSANPAIRLDEASYRVTRDGFGQAQSATWAHSSAIYGLSEYRVVVTGITLDPHATKAQLLCPADGGQGGLANTLTLTTTSPQEPITACSSFQLTYLTLVKDFAAGAGGVAADWQLIAQPDTGAAVSVRGDEANETPVEPGTYTLAEQYLGSDEAWRNAEATWTCTSTWPGNVPTSGAEVTIAAGDLVTCTAVNARKLSPNLSVSIEPSAKMVVRQNPVAIQYRFDITVENSSTSSGAVYSLDNPWPTPPIDFVPVEQSARGPDSEIPNWSGGSLAKDVVIAPAASGVEPAQHRYQVTFTLEYQGDVPNVPNIALVFDLVDKATLSADGASKTVSAESSVQVYPVFATKEAQAPVYDPATRSWSVSYAISVRSESPPGWAMFHLRDSLENNPGLDLTTASYEVLDGNGSAVPVVGGSWSYLGITSTEATFTVKVSHIRLAAGATPEQLTCPPGGAGGLINRLVATGGGEIDIPVCTSFEAPQAAQLKLVKAFGEGSPGVAGDWRLTASYDGSEELSVAGDAGTYAPLLPGSYELGESYLGADPDWARYSAYWSCVAEEAGELALSGSRVDLPEGDSVTCTVTNAQQSIPHSLTSSMKALDVEVISQNPVRLAYRYQIEVVNESTETAVKYALENPRPVIPDGMVIAGSIASGPGGAIPGWNGADTRYLATNATIAAAPSSATPTIHTYEVTWELQFGARLPQVESSTCALPLPNRATLETDGKNDEITAIGCVALMKAVVTKIVKAKEFDRLTDTWRVAYDVAVWSSEPAWHSFYRLEDTLLDNPAIDLTGASYEVTKDAGAFASASQWSYEGAAIGEPTVFTMTVSGLKLKKYATEAELTCGVGNPGGLTNQAALETTDGNDVVADCASFQQNGVQLAKELTSLTNDAGVWQAVYQLTISGEDPSLEARYEVEDRFAFPREWLQEKPKAAASASVGDAPTIEPAWDGTTQTWLARDQVLPAGATHTYTLTVRVKVPAGVEPEWLRCPPSGVPEGGGLLNVAWAYPGSGQPATACGDVVRFAVGGIAWVDDGDGIREPGDQPAGGVGVRLLLGAGALETHTGADGRYVFDAIVPGTYQLELFDLPAGHKAAPVMASGLADTSSHFDPATLRTAPFTLDVGADGVGALPDGLPLAASYGTMAKHAGLVPPAEPGPPPPDDGLPDTGEGGDDGGSGEPGDLPFTGTADGVLTAIAAALALLLVGVAAAATARSRRRSSSSGEE